MFERFTDRTRRVLVYAQEEARDLDHAYIGTEHLLLGLIREAEGVAAKAIDALGLTYDVVRDNVQSRTEIKPNSSSTSPPFTPQAKKVLGMSLREALELRTSYIGTEHLLLGLVRHGEGTAVQILYDLGVELPQVRAQVLELMQVSEIREVDEPRLQVRFESSAFRSLVRAMGQQLRSDLDASELDSRAERIADDLLTQLRQSWVEPERPL
ncbi:MAG TPA: Clp protease N-terminal domain-containing protein [Acidimicrobiales bacterium]